MKALKREAAFESSILLPVETRRSLLFHPYPEHFRATARAVALPEERHVVTTGHDFVERFFNLRFTSRERKDFSPLHRV